MKNTIQALNIRTNKFNSNEVEVTFNDGAKMNVCALTLAPSKEVEVFTENRTLKAERYTKKYLEALKQYINNCRIDVVTYKENEQKIEYKVFQVGNKITAVKYDMATGEKLCTYDWSNYGHITDIAKEYAKTENWHYRYTFYLVSISMAETTAKTIASDIQKNVPFELDKKDVKNLANTIEIATTGNKKTLYAFIVDSEKSIHMVFKENRNRKVIHDGLFIEVDETYSVHSAFYVGKDDNYNYNGLYRGKYDIVFYDDAEFEIRKRSQGEQLYKDLAF